MKRSKWEVKNNSVNASQPRKHHLIASSTLTHKDQAIKPPSDSVSSSVLTTLIKRVKDGTTPST